MSNREKAAVLVPVYRDNSGELILVLVRRTDGDIHGGQIAFPGGKISPQDKSLKETALRETEEEIGLPESNIKIVEELPGVYTQTSRFDITPFLAKIVRPKQWKLSEREIAEIIEVSIKAIADPKSYGEEIKNFTNWAEPRMVPFYKIDKHQIWGATFRILSPIVTDLINNKWKI